MRRRRVARAALALALTLLASIAFVAIVTLRALQPRAGEWSMHVGPVSAAQPPEGTDNSLGGQRAQQSWRLWNHEVSVPVLLRWATHPLALPLLDGRSLRTRAGTWRLETRAARSAESTQRTLTATCEPCVLRLPELGPAPLVFERVVLHAGRAGPEVWAGTLELGPTAGAVSVAWEAQLKREGLAWTARLDPTPVAALLATLRDGTVPEARRAHVVGTFAFDASAVLNAQGFAHARVHPRVEGLVVEGLGTEALAIAAPPARCKPIRERIDGWLPRAVIAAEDQRFFEHNGFDVEEAMQAWIGNRDRDAVAAPVRRRAVPESDRPPRGAAGEASVGAGSPRGASTITQQLAKLIYTGDDRSAARKLREWLYAVEMERTLGKGRILQLYLAMAPWGGEVCGGEAASRRYLGKAASRLAPHEAAWLASLLRGPDAQLARWRDTAAVDAGRVARVIDGLRPMPKRQREQYVEELERWQPAVRGVASYRAGA